MASPLTVPSQTVSSLNWFSTSCARWPSRTDPATTPAPHPTRGRDASRLQLGGRIAADIAGHFSAFSELLVHLPLAPAAERGGLLLVGGGIRGFRGLHLQGYYGLATGPLTGSHVAGVALDVPIGLVVSALVRFSAAVDPVVGGDGWMYDDECRPMFRVGASDGDRVWDETRKAWVPIGTHLWRKGEQLCFDPECHQPYGPVRRTPGETPPLVAGVVTLPWPTIRDTSAATPEGRAWLRRYFLAPDPARREMCAALMESAIDLINKGARAPTLSDGCREVMDGLDRMGTESDGRMRQGTMPGLALGRLIADAILCGRDPVVASAALGTVPVAKGGGVGKPGSAATAAARPVNRRGEPYPVAPDLKSGGEMPFPQGELRAVPPAERLAWTTNHRRQYITEWHNRGFPRPPRVNPATVDPWDDYDIHHVRPLQYGGGNDFDNLTPLPRAVHRVVTDWWRAYDKH